MTAACLTALIARHWTRYEYTLSTVLEDLIVMKTASAFSLIPARNAFSMLTRLRSRTSISIRASSAMPPFILGLRWDGTSRGAPTIAYSTRIISSPEEKTYAADMSAGACMPILQLARGKLQEAL